WEKNETHTQVAGSTLEWQLEFANRLTLSIRRPDSEEEEAIIDVDSPETEPEATNGQIESAVPIETTTTDPDLTIPTPQSPEIAVPAKRGAPFSTLEPQEFASPAFLKRARVSYGSLFEGGLDIFDDDVSKKTKSKRRTRFSLPANAWRYNSQSPSPEPEEVPQEADENSQADASPQQNGQVEDTPMLTPPRPPMIDQGCQTVDVDFTPMASVQVLAESRPTFGFPLATPTPLPRTRPIEADNATLGHSIQLQGDSEVHQDIHQETPADLLGHSDHIDTGITFGFTPQAVLFPTAPGLFPSGHEHDATPESPTRGARVEEYPAEFLDAPQLPPNNLDAHSALSSHDSHISPQPVDGHVSFDTEPALHPTFGAVTQPSLSPWATEASPGPLSTAIASTDVENPVEILSSSPLRERESSEERPSSPRGENQGESLGTNLSPEPALEEPSSEAEHYRDGGDEPGDDYDLRNYDRAHDDDDDVESSEEEQDVNNDDPEAQIMNPEEEEADEDEEVDEQEEEELDEAADGYEEGMYEERYEEEAEEYAGSEIDAEGEYYSDEEGSYDEDEDEDEDGAETAAVPSRVMAPQEPVFISLLSDSEDEDEPVPQSKPEPELADNPRSPPEDEQRVEVEEKTEAEAVTQAKTPEFVSPLKQSPRSTPDEMDQASKMEDDSHDNPEEPGGNRGHDLPTAGEMGDNTEKSHDSAAPDTTRDEDLEFTTQHKETTDGESTHKSPPIQSPPAMPEQETQEEQGEEEPEAALGKTQAGDLEMDDAPVLAEKSKDDAERENISMNHPNEAHPAAAEEPAEAMDIDETHETPGNKDDGPTPTTSLEIADTTIVVSEEVHGTITEGAPGSLTSDKVALVEEKVFAETRATPENGVEPSKSPAAPAVGMSLAREGAGATPGDREEVMEVEAESPERVESPDASMQDASVEATAKSGPQPTVTVALTGNSEGAAEEANGGSDGHLAADGQISPPATQVSHAQPLQNSGEEALLFSQATSFISIDEHGAHLPTPGETQQVDEVDMADSLLTTNHNNPTDEDDVGPEDQIMAEILQHSPVQQDAPKFASPAECSPTISLPKSSPRTGLTEGPHDTPSRNPQRAPEASGPAKSLRSRRRRSTKSSDQGDASQLDPSILLARGSAAPSHGDRDVKHISPTGSVRMTRSRADREDPSIQLARASMQTEEPKTRTKRKATTDGESIVSANSSPGSLRVTRQRVDHGDPSILLAKGSSPSTRQTRSRPTPDHRRETPKRETRSASRSLQLQENTPGASSTALKSPSIAGSTATAAEDESVGALKLQLLKTLRTSLPDYLSLKLLRNSLNKTTDILAIATATPAQPYRPKHGPRDYMLTLNLTDPSVAPTGVSVAHIFRQHQYTLPIVHAGDVVLLRRVNVVSMKGRGFGVRSGDASAWAVFEKADEEMLPQIKGPPMEIAEDEVKYAEGLRRWWSLQDDKAMEKIERASRKVTEAGKEDTK
ncbi:hypothetical protein FDECE_90, partial [Fusarium decemcellulare]